MNLGSYRIDYPILGARIGLLALHPYIIACLQLGMINCNEFTSHRRYPSMLL